MIIAAYAGTGKSTFAVRIEDTVDLPIMPYRWILPPTDKPPAELEGEKGALYRLADPRFPTNYLYEILNAERMYKFVLIPTNAEVIRHLQEDYGRKVLLCYPKDICREEYRERFIARGNSASFLELFIDGWDCFLRPLRENRQGIHISMEPGEYLTDLYPRFEEESRSDITGLVSEETLRSIAEKTESRQRDLVLYLCGDNGWCFYSIADLDAPEEREFLHQIGQMIFDRDICQMVAPKRCFWKETFNAYLTSERGKVKAFIEGA